MKDAIHRINNEFFISIPWKATGGGHLFEVKKEELKTLWDYDVRVKMHTVPNLHTDFS